MRFTPHSNTLPCCNIEALLVIIPPPAALRPLLWSWWWRWHSIFIFLFIFIFISIFISTTTLGRFEPEGRDGVEVGSDLG